LRVQAPPGFEPGWRFCRFRRVLQVVESSCSLVSGTPRFSMVFGRSWTDVGLKFLRPAGRLRRHVIAGEIAMEDIAAANFADRSAPRLGAGVSIGWLPASAAAK
jgi:hypothetical protein